MENLEKEKNVVFVTTSSPVSDLFYNIFKNDEELKNYYILGQASNREQAVKYAQENSGTLFLFIEKTPGIMSLSETLYKLRLYNSRIIFISSERAPGDQLLEVVVGYGIYDIILSDEITQDQIKSFIKSPRRFSDVALFYRMPEIPDSGNGQKLFEIPDLDTIRNMTTNIEKDYLTTPEQRAAESIPAHIDNEDDKKDIFQRIFKKKEKEKVKKVKKSKKRNPVIDDFGDLD